MKDKLIISVPYPVAVLSIVFVLVWWAYALCSPLIDWYSAIIERHALLVRAQAQAESQQLTLQTIKKEPLMMEYLTLQNKAKKKARQ